MESIEVAAIPSGILDYLSNTNKSFQRKPNDYWVTDICKCLRQSYYQIAGTPVDNNIEPDIESLWVLQSRKFLHNLTYAYKWRELDIEKEVQLDDGGKVKLHGRLDMYDYVKGNMIDLKTSNSIKWQLARGSIPRTCDIDQIQCYGSLFSSLIKVSTLTLLYADLKDLIAFKVPLMDRSYWIRARIVRLSSALVIAKHPPAAERSSRCDFCQYRKRCDEEKE